MKLKRIAVNDRMQRGYHYELSAPVGKKFHSDFTPELTPKEILTLGAFGGVYMRDCTKEFPKSWFAKARFAPKETYEHLPGMNHFGVNASQPLSVWRKKGWIHKD
ncbi:MAG TPA: hypothetical protein VJ837_05735, partial [Candidatus Paceibacterota bacterium]|nr:hypothetical protein [Candidatus Paceibacterota bacterium]